MLILGKGTRKKLVKCFVWIVALYGAETWTLQRNEQKELEAFEIWIWRRMESVKCTDKMKNAFVKERMGEKIIILELIKKGKRNWLGHWLRRNCLLKDTLEHGCANHATEGKCFCPPSSAVTQRSLPTCSVAIYVLHPCSLIACMCTPSAVGAAVSASLCSEHVTLT